ncbi:MAG: universal stress protein [Planctomycetes bacterium]|nr:universal stress protein [Planctomycetota bacterium]MCB9870103.1 universal stress protein [Planctomycetota bacterium]
MKRILLTTDFSPQSRHAFPEATGLAKALGAGITLLHVVVDLRTAPQGAPFAPPLSSPGLADEIAEAREAIAKLTTEFPGVDVRTEVVSSENVVRAIAQFASEPQNEISMLAMSTHGRSGWRHWILGSVAEEVLRVSPVPVVVFPRAAS